MKKNTPKLVKGQKARTNKGFQENIKREKSLGKSEKRAVGTAYGEDYLAYDKSKAKARKKHADEKEDRMLVRSMVKKKCVK